MTTVQESAAVRGGIWVLCPALGAAVLWGLVALADWVAGLPWFPFKGVFELVASWPDRWVVPGALVLGAVAGLVLAALWSASMLSVSVSPSSVSLRRGDKHASFARSDVATVFVDGKCLVLLDSTGAELARDRSDLRASVLESAFTSLGYPWRADGDPFAASYRMWVEHTPDLPAHVNALMASRSRALKSYEDSEATELADELRKYGVFVRDVKKRQYWRS